MGCNDWLRGRAYQCANRGNLCSPSHIRTRFLPKIDPSYVTTSAKKKKKKKKRKETHWHLPNYSCFRLSHLRKHFVCVPFSHDTKHHLRNHSFYKNCSCKRPRLTRFQGISWIQVDTHSVDSYFLCLDYAFCYITCSLHLHWYWQVVSPPSAVKWQHHPLIFF